MSRPVALPLQVRDREREDWICNGRAKKCREKIEVLLQAEADQRNWTECRVCSDIENRDKQIEALFEKQALERRFRLLPPRIQQEWATKPGKSANIANVLTESNASDIP